MGIKWTYAGFPHVGVGYLYIVASGCWGSNGCAVRDAVQAGPKREEKYLEGASTG